MQAHPSTRVVRVRQATNILDSVLANCLKRFDDGTALVRFEAGNCRTVPIGLIEPASDAEELEYYRVRESWLRHTSTDKVPPVAQKP
jgi:hypothetical protein